MATNRFHTVGGFDSDFFTRASEDRDLCDRWLKSLPEAEVVAISDLDANLLNRVADEFHIGKRSADFRALLDDPAIEAIGICVPAQFHVKLALAALDAGKHLFIEKPLALDLDKIDRLMERAAKSSSKIMVGFDLRWHRLLRQARNYPTRDLGASRIGSRCSNKPPR